MKDQIDCRTHEGESFRFALFCAGRPLSPMGGNYLYVRHSPEGPVIVGCGVADNLALRAQCRWTEAVERHGADALYTRLNITRSARMREHQLILETACPPMNADERDAFAPDEAAPFERRSAA